MGNSTVEHWLRANMPHNRTEMREHALVLKAVILIDGKIPLFRREKGGDVWYTLPGGKPEPHDADIAEAIQREVMQELGIEITVPDHDIIDVIKHPKLKDSAEAFVYCEYKSGEPKNMEPKEHLELLMVEPRQAAWLLDNRISPQVRQFILDLGTPAKNLALERLKPPGRIEPA